MKCKTSGCSNETFVFTTCKVVSKKTGKALQPLWCADCIKNLLTKNKSNNI